MSKILIIAEIAQAHDGSIGIAHSYIDALSKTGVDAIKFQMHIADAESSIYEPFRVNFSYKDKTRYDYWKRIEFSFDEWIELKKHCESKNLEFICSPFSNKAVDVLEQLQVNRYKIGSGEVSNYLLLHKIAKTQKPILLSSGMSNLKELDESIKFLKSFNINLTLLQCITKYPTLPGEWGFDLIPFLKKRYKIPIGFSDHSGLVLPIIASAILGAEVIEFHAVYDKEMFGPDSMSSITINQIKNVVNDIRLIEKERSLNSGKIISPHIEENKKIFEKSLSINKDIEEGAIISFYDLESKKPSGKGINPKLYNNVIGKKASRKLTKYQFLNSDDII